MRPALGLLATAILAWSSSARGDGTITVTIAGNGSVTSTVSAKTNTSIDCPATTCAVDFNNSDRIVLTAAPGDTGLTVTWATSGNAASTNCPQGLTCSIGLPGYGAGHDEAVTATFSNPVPAITSLTPSSAFAGDPDTSVAVVGTGFVHASSVQFAGSDRTTTYGSDTQLAATFTAADLAVAGSFDVTVTNPSPGGGTSGAAQFTVSPAPPDAAMPDDAAAPGEDAAAAGEDAAAPGEDAAAPGLDAGGRPDAAGLDASVGPDAARLADSGSNEDASLESPDAAELADASPALDAELLADAQSTPSDAALNSPDAEQLAPDATEITLHDLGGCGCGVGGGSAAFTLALAGALALLAARRRHG